MICFVQKNKSHSLYKAVCFLVALAFGVTLIGPLPYAQAQGVLNLPTPGVMVSASAGFAPAIIKGITIHPDNPLQFDFIIDTGDSKIKGEELRIESKKLIKYFLASLTVPEEDLWVNLSPYEKDRIISEGLGLTEMGRDMLAQDYLLKQLTASMIYPEDNLGKKFWERVYAKAQTIHGTTDIPVNTFNKVWIVPDKAVVYEEGASAFVVKRHLKVMLEEDYLALQSNLDSKEHGIDQLNTDDVTSISKVSSDVIREVLLPELEKEVNEGKNFANLRQIYNSMILATWYKINLRESLLGQVYMDQNKIRGVDVEDKEISQKIYQQYVEAFQKGVYDFIKEDYDTSSQKVIPRKYFSGGLGTGVVKVQKLEVLKADEAPLAPQDARMIAQARQPDSPDSSLYSITAGVVDVGPDADENEVTRVDSARVQITEGKDGVDNTMLSSAGLSSQEEALLAQYGYDESRENEFFEGYRKGTISLDRNKIPAEQITAPTSGPTYDSDIKLLAEKESQESRLDMEASEERLRQGLAAMGVPSGGLWTRGARISGGRPKGVIPLIEIEGEERSLFECRFANGRWVRDTYGRLHLGFMTSFGTDEMTKEYFAENDNFGMGEDVDTYTQGITRRLIPTVDDLKEKFNEASVKKVLDGTITEADLPDDFNHEGGLKDWIAAVMASKDHGGEFYTEGNPFNPPGHFDAAGDLVLSGLLLKWINKGVEDIHIPSLDNIPGGIDPRIHGAFVRSGKDLIVEVTGKSARLTLNHQGTQEDLGTVLLVGGKLIGGKDKGDGLQSIMLLDRYEVTVTPNGEIVSVFDSDNEEEMLNHMKVDKKEDRGGLPVVVNGIPMLQEQLTFPADFDQSQLLYFNAFGFWTTAKALLIAFGFDPEDPIGDYRKAFNEPSKERLIKKVNEVYSMIPIHVEIKIDTYVDKDGKQHKRPVAQKTQLLGDLMKLYHQRGLSTHFLGVPKEERYSQLKDEKDVAIKGDEIRAAARPRLKFDDSSERREGKDNAMMAEVEYSGEVGPDIDIHVQGAFAYEKGELVIGDDRMEPHFAKQILVNAESFDEEKIRKQLEEYAKKRELTPGEEIEIKIDFSDTLFIPKEGGRFPPDENGRFTPHERALAELLAEQIKDPEQRKQYLEQFEEGFEEFNATRYNQNHPDPLHKRYELWTRALATEGIRLHQDYFDALAEEMIVNPKFIAVDKLIREILGVSPVYVIVSGNLQQGMKPAILKEKEMLNQHNIKIKEEMLAPNLAAVFPDNAILTEAQAEEQIETFFESENSFYLKRGPLGERSKKTKEIAAELLMELDGEAPDYKIFDTSVSKKDIMPSGDQKIDLNQIKDSDALDTFSVIVLWRVMGSLKRPNIKDKKKRAAEIKPQDLTMGSLLQATQQPLSSGNLKGGLLNSNYKVAIEDFGAKVVNPDKARIRLIWDRTILGRKGRLSYVPPIAQPYYAEDEINAMKVIKEQQGILAEMFPDYEIFHESGNFDEKVPNDPGAVVKVSYIDIKVTRKQESLDNAMMEKEETDAAMMSNLGGINLNPELLDLQIKRDGNGVPLPVNQQPIGEMRIDGFLPIIINVSPIPSLPFHLGAVDVDDDEDSSDLNGDLSLDPMDQKKRFEEISALLIKFLFLGRGMGIYPVLQPRKCIWYRSRFQIHFLG